MNNQESQFEKGRRETYIQDFHRSGSYREDYSFFSRRRKFDFANSVETNENEEGFIFRIPLSEVSLENLKIIPSKKYIIVQSNKKTIFINLNNGNQSGKIMTSIKDDMLLIEIKK